MYRSLFAAAVLAAVLTGTGATAAPLAEPSSGRCGACGTVVDVDPIFARGRRVGGGALLGALVGGAVGNRVGSGNGATTIAGAAAGAAMGYGAAQRGRAVSGYEITVRMDDGATETVKLGDDFGLDRGDRVTVLDGAVLRL